VYKDKNILAVIPARGGSKGIHLKNMQVLGNLTLVEWALFTALNCKEIDRTVVSTDLDTIINIANKHGDFAPFKRPQEFSTDEAPSLPVFNHALEWAEKNDNMQYDIILVLAPTTPFRLTSHINQGLKLLIEKKASSVISLVEVGDPHPIRIKKLVNGQVEPYCIPEPEGLRRQDQDAAYIRNCAVNIFSRETIINGQLWGENQYGFKMDNLPYGINIDEPTDLLLAQNIFDKYNKEKSLHLLSNHYIN
jgi:CMP-N-acetylneuraminic acid synthetase